MGEILGQPLGLDEDGGAMPVEPGDEHRGLIGGAGHLDAFHDRRSSRDGRVPRKQENPREARGPRPPGGFQAGI
ncbi:hypothetical protein GCM10027176_64660 [Actinoallomurus bryophytorum]